MVAVFSTFLQRPHTSPMCTPHSWGQPPCKVLLYKFLLSLAPICPICNKMHLSLTLLLVCFVSFAYQITAQPLLRHSLRMARHHHHRPSRHAITELEAPMVEVQQPLVPPDAHKIPENAADALKTFAPLIKAWQAWGSKLGKFGTDRSDGSKHRKGLPSVSLCLP